VFPLEEEIKEACIWNLELYGTCNVATVWAKWRVLERLTW